jgi:hypothetical protein
MLLVTEMNHMIMLIMYTPMLYVRYQNRFINAGISKTLKLLDVRSDYVTLIGRKNCLVKWRIGHCQSRPL